MELIVSPLHRLPGALFREEISWCMKLITSSSFEVKEWNHTSISLFLYVPSRESFDFTES
jgi:hypothetical protein